MGVRSRAVRTGHPLRRAAVLRRVGVHPRVEGKIKRLIVSALHQPIIIPLFTSLADGGFGRFFAQFGWIVADIFVISENGLALFLDLQKEGSHPGLQAHRQPVDQQG